MENNSETRALIAEINEDAILFDGLDKAIIGMSSCDNIPVVVYDVEKIINILFEENKAIQPHLSDGVHFESAESFFQYNIEGHYTSENSPILVYSLR